MRQFFLEIMGFRKNKILFFLIEKKNFFLELKIFLGVQLRCRKTIPFDWWCFWRDWSKLCTVSSRLKTKTLIFAGNRTLGPNRPPMFDGRNNVDKMSEYDMLYREQSRNHENQLPCDFEVKRSIFHHVMLEKITSFIFLRNGIAYCGI